MTARVPGTGPQSVGWIRHRSSIACPSRHHSPGVLPLMLASLLGISLIAGGCAGNVKSVLKRMEEQQKYEDVSEPLNTRLQHANQSVAAGDTLLALHEYRLVEERAQAVAESLVEAGFNSKDGVAQLGQIRANARWNLLGVHYEQMKRQYNVLARRLNETREAGAAPPDNRVPAEQLYVGSCGRGRDEGEVLTAARARRGGGK
jgi:hypothetical protein